MPLTLSQDAGLERTVRPPAVRVASVSYASPGAAFDAGDYVYAAAQAGEDQLLRGAALIMMGHYEGGVPYLADRAEPMALYYRAVAHWGRGELHDAQHCLTAMMSSSRATSDDIHRAEQLKTLVEGPPLRILVQGRNEPPPSSFGIVSAMKQTTSEVISIGYQESDDLTLEPYEDMTSVLNRLPRGWRPDLFLCYQLESNLFPVGLDRLDCPAIGYMSDYDSRVHTAYHRAQEFDLMAVTGSGDHWEVSQGFRLPTVAFPKAVGIAAKAFADVDVASKDCDVFCSGTSMTLYQVDKGQLAYRLMQLADTYRVRVRQGFLPASDYVQATARSRVVFSFVRRQPVWSSRVLEALAAGAVALYQEGSGLDLFFREDEGAIPYREENLELVVARVLNQWTDTYASAALRGRARVLKEFDLVVCMERFLKHLALTAMAAPPVRGRRGEHEHHASRRNPPYLRGAFVVSPLQKKRVWKAAFLKTADRIRSIPSERRTCSDFNLLAFAHFAIGYRIWQARSFESSSRGPATDIPPLKDSLAAFKESLRHYPQSMALRFNYGRVCYYLGYHRVAYRIFGELLTDQALQLDPLDDLWGDDFGNRELAFRAYIDEVIEYLVTRNPVSLERMRAIVLSSVWCYRSRLEHLMGNGELAVQSSASALRTMPYHAPLHEQFCDVAAAVSRPDRSLIAQARVTGWKLTPYSWKVLRRIVEDCVTDGRLADAADYLDRYNRIARTIDGRHVPQLAIKHGRGQATVSPQDARAVLVGADQAEGEEEGLA